MNLYIFFYVIIFTTFVFFTLVNLFESKKFDKTDIFYLISSIILSYLLPIFFFKYQNYVISSLIILIILGLITILSFKLYKFNISTSLYCIPAWMLTYYTFCYILAINLTS
ncbi:MAG: hypothetical protein R3Y13_01795 [bacterium]